MRRAVLILAANRETAALIPACYQSRVRTMLGIGMSASEVASGDANGSPRGSLVVVFVGVLRPIKGGALAIKAFQSLVRLRPDATLVFLGDGSERARLAALAKDMGISDRVRFEGWLGRDKVQEWIRSADLLLLPSLRDSGGMALMEAMVAEKPVICLDLGGPGEIVTPECGFKVRPGNPGQVVLSLAMALEKLSADPKLRRSMGEAGRRRVLAHFEWDKRGEQMMEFYSHVRTLAPNP
jgi:glycosyltransferase involved in cell wall biosynthesis